MDLNAVNFVIGHTILFNFGSNSSMAFISLTYANETDRMSSVNMFLFSLFSGSHVHLKKNLNL